MSSKILRSVVAGLTACMFLALFSGCGTEKSSGKASPDTWPSSTWTFDSATGDGNTSTDADGNTVTTLIKDRFTFSGNNTGRFARTVSFPEPTDDPAVPYTYHSGNYTYSKTGNNTGTLLMVFDGGGITLSINLTFDTPNSGRGAAVAPHSNFGDRIYQLVFRRV